MWVRDWDFEVRRREKIRNLLEEGEGGEGGVDTIYKNAVTFSLLLFQLLSTESITMCLNYHISF